MQPGWRWSECIKPMVGSESCQIDHVGTVAAGQFHVLHEDGTELEVGPGDASSRTRPRRVGGGFQPFVCYEFDSSAEESSPGAEQERRREPWTWEKRGSAGPAGRSTSGVCTAVSVPRDAGLCVSV